MNIAVKAPWDSSDEKVKELKTEDFGSPEEVWEMAKTDRHPNSYAEARAILNGFVGKPLKSKSNVVATISKNAINEILSGEAVDKSFDFHAHLWAE
jgi:hypothetical protein